MQQLRLSIRDIVSVKFFRISIIKPALSCNAKQLDKSRSGFERVCIPTLNDVSRIDAACTATCKRCEFLSIIRQLNAGVHVQLIAI